jgi:hypothetical protein
MHCYAMLKTKFKQRLLGRQAYVGPHFFVTTNLIDIDMALSPIIGRRKPMVC